MKGIFVLILSCLLFISMASALSVNIPVPAISSNASTNDSLYWDGHAFILKHIVI